MIESRRSHDSGNHVGDDGTADFSLDRALFDSIVVNAGDDTLAGGNGDDVLTGGPGNDTINSGTGNDTVNG